MTGLRESNFDFISSITNILKDFQNKCNVELDELKIDSHYEEISVEVFFKNSETAKNEFFEFFKSIGYTVTNNHFLTEEDYYDKTDYPNGATVIPIYARLYFGIGIDEVCYDFENIEIKPNAKNPMVAPDFTKMIK